MIFYRHRWFGHDKNTGDSIAISRKARMYELYDKLTVVQKVITLWYIIDQSSDDKGMNQTDLLEILQNYTTWKETDNRSLKRNV